MPITIGQNIYSLAAGRRLAQASEEVSASSQRLSSGLRINRPSDDAAGLAVSSTLNARARVFTQGLRNFSDAQSFLAISEGALSNLSNVTIRLRELATQAANGTFSRTQRLSLQSESDELTKEFNRVIATTAFNGLKSLDRSLTSIRFQGSFGTDGGIDTSLAQAVGRARGRGTVASTSSFGVTTTEQVALDFNGDGKMDLVSANSTGNLSVYVGNGDGTFTAGSPATLATTYASGALLKVGDFDGDGKQDLVAATRQGASDSIQIFSNRGGVLTLTDSQSLGLNGTATQLEVADVNGDGRSDVVAVSSLSTFVITKLGQAGGTLGASSSVNTGSYNLSISLGDPNGDGKVDLLAVDSDYLTATLFDGTGSGGFSTVGRLISSDALMATIADVNRDGFDDIVITDSSSAFQLYKSRGNGSFAQSALGISNSGFSAGALIDVDGDGFTDILTSDGATLTTFRGRGDGTFDGGLNSSYIGFFTSASVADFNGDGVVDFAGHASGGSLRVGTQTTSSVGTIKTVTLATQSSARDAMGYFDDLLTRIGAELGNLGAAQSRLTSAFNALSAERENSQSAAGRIQDSDVASETARLVRSQILQQIGSSILSQANQLPRIAVDLLRGI